MSARRRLRVFAAGSLRPAFDLLAAAAPAPPELSYGNARDLADRIRSGETADVFASASGAHPHALYEAGLVGRPRAFASNRLVVAVPAASGAGDSGILAAVGVRVVIEIAGIPLGDYTRELVTRLDELAGGRFAERVFANVVSQEQTVDDVAARLRDGQADAAVLYATDVAARSGALRAIEPPAAAAVTTTCFACVVSSSARRDSGETWVRSLGTPAAAELLRRTGFGAPPVIDPTASQHPRR